MRYSIGPVRTTFLSVSFSILNLATHAGTPRRMPLSGEEIDRTFQRIDRRERIETDTLLRALASDQTTLRARAAALLGETGDASVVPALVAALSDESIHVGAHYPDAGMATTRWWANNSLKKLTKQDFGFRWDAPKPERETAINKWTQWLASSK